MEVSVNSQGQGERIDPKLRCKKCSGKKVNRERKILEVSIDWWLQRLYYRTCGRILELLKPDPNIGKVHTLLSTEIFFGGLAIEEETRRINFETLTRDDPWSLDDLDCPICIDLVNEPVRL